MNKVVLVAGAAAVAVLGVGSVFLFGDYSDGQRAGQVVKFSYKGTIPGCKTWEGEMVMGGLRSRNAAEDANANIFRFTVSNSEVVKQIQHKLETGETALLTYKQPYWNMPCTTDTGYFVTKVNK